LGHLDSSLHSDVDVNAILTSKRPADFTKPSLLCKYLLPFIWTISQFVLVILVCMSIYSIILNLSMSLKGLIVTVYVGMTLALR